MLEPIYTIENVQPAYQLLYTLTVFWRTAPGTDSWIDELREQIEADGIRILRHRFRDVKTSQFFVSTKPSVAPTLIPARVKGRLQHLLRGQIPSPFQRNYDLTSIGSTGGEKTQAYVAGQIEHHQDDFPDLRKYQDLQVLSSDIDLLKPRFTRRGRCTCNLHLVLVNQDRKLVTDKDALIRVRNVIRKWALREQCYLGQIGVLPDHFHVTFGLNPETQPIEAVLSIMNNIVWVYGMDAVLMYSFRVNTFGPYDVGVIGERD